MIRRSLHNVMFFCCDNKKIAPCPDRDESPGTRVRVTGSAHAGGRLSFGRLSRYGYGKHIENKNDGLCHYPIQRALIAFFFNQPHSWIHGSAVATPISIPRSAAAAEGRDPRPTAAEGSDRPKAAIDGGRRPASGRVEPAEHESVQRRQFILVRKEGPFDPPLCVSPLVCPSDAMLLPSSAIRHAMAPLRPAQVPCRLNE